MATKRTATTELTHENWNDDTPAEEAGCFQVATKEELSRRVVRVAKRRLDEGGCSSPSTFSGFSGFGSASGLAAKPSFDFLKPAVPPKTEKDAVGGAIESNGLSFTFRANSANSNGSDEKPPPPKLHILPSAAASAPPSSTGGIQAAVAKSPVNSQRSEYLRQLRSLNESVVAWIKQHVDKNPFCVLTPIFHDYSQYLQELEQKYPEADKVRMKPVSSGQRDVTPVDAKTSFTSFKFNPSTDSRLGSNPAESRTTAKEDDEDDYQPPKNEVQEVKEEDALYSKRCKLFYKKDAAYIDKGVGTLYLKTAGDKTQLLVRAETNLGNILLNILLTSSVPLQRVGKKDISLVCIPNPPLDLKATPEKPEPATFLVRVKGEADADELLQKLNEFKV